MLLYASVLPPVCHLEDMYILFKNPLPQTYICVWGSQFTVPVSCYCLGSFGL